jgi:hypothetical protein
VGKKKILGADDGAGRGCFLSAALGEAWAGLLVVPRVAVGEADHADGMPRRTVQRRRPAPGIVGVVGMSTDDQQSQRSVHSHPGASV